MRHLMIIGSGICFLLMLGCSTSQFGWKVEGEQKKASETKQGDIVEDFDPLTLEDDDIEIAAVPNAVKRDTAQIAVQTTSADDMQSEEAQAVEVDGFRVQLLTSGDYQRAREEKTKAMMRFDIPVYLQFEAPLYRLRIGDCVDRKAAEELRQKAIGLGYSGAWILPSKVTPQQ